MTDAEDAWAALLILSGYFPSPARRQVMLNYLDTLERVDRQAGRKPPAWIQELRERATVFVDVRGERR